MPPLADLQVSVTSGSNPLLLTFDAGGSTDPDGQLIAYRLDLGDGSPPIDLDPGFLQATHVYNRFGTGPILVPTTFDALLTVTDDSGDQHSTMVSVMVNP